MACVRYCGRCYLQSHYIEGEQTFSHAFLLQTVFLIPFRNQLEYAFFATSFTIYIFATTITFLQHLVCLFQGFLAMVCLTDVSVFAEFPMVVTPLCKLPCGGILQGAGPLIWYTPDLKQDCSTSFTLPQAIQSGKKQSNLSIQRWKSRGPIIYHNSISAIFYL